MEEDSQKNTFDIESGVAEIADSMGFDSKEQEPDVINEATDKANDENELIPDQNNQTENEEVKLSSAPESWAKEQRDNWSKIPEDTQKYIELREKQMLDGIEQYKSGHQYGVYIDQALAPYRGVMEANGVDEVQAIVNLFEHHKALTEGTLEQRQQALVRIGMASGIIPQEGQKQPDPIVSQLQQRLSSIEQQEQNRQRQYQQQIQAKVANDVDRFASDPENIYFNDVAEEVIQLIRLGYDLTTAYQKAIWLNPVTRDKEVARQNSELAKKATDEALKAKRAISSNIKSANVSVSSREPVGSWEDTMRDVLARAKTTT